jgi:hypothetical protein
MHHWDVINKVYEACFLDLLFDHDDGGSTYIRRVGKVLPEYRRHILEDGILHRPPHEILKSRMVRFIYTRRLHAVEVYENRADDS